MTEYAIANTLATVANIFSDNKFFYRHLLLLKHFTSDGERAVTNCYR